MALELKRRPKENLKKLRVFIEDTSDNSPEYFSIVEFPEFFGDGKSLIRLKGNRDRLQENTPIQVEVLDQAGNPMYYEFSTIKNSDDTIIISVWTYSGRGDRYDTAPGIGEVIIVGTVRDVPDEFRDVPNVRWTRKVPIDIQQLAPSKIVFKPSVLPKGSVSASIQVIQNLPQSNGELRQTDVSTNVKYKKSVWGTTTSLEWQSGTTFNSEMISGSIYLDVGNSTLFPRLTGQTQPSTFTASIKDVDSTTILRLTSPFTSSDGRSDGSVHTYEYSDGDALTANIRYFTSASTVTTQNQVSFANVTLTNVNPETGRIASVNTLIKSEGSGGDFEFVGNTKVNQNTTFTYRVAIPTEHLNDVKTLKVQYLNQQGQVSKQETIIKNVVFPGGNVYIGGNQSIVTGSLFIANAIGSGLEMGGHSSGFLKSVGYDGVTSASLGLGPGGFILYSGSNALQMGADVLQGVGMQFVGDNDDRHLIFTTANGGLLDVKTDKFFIGTTDSQFLSGSDGNIEISSSLFHLDPVNNLLVIGADAVINADLSANNIRTPATIGGLPSTDLNASSSISSEGLARFVSASIGGWNVNTSSIFSSNLEINSAGRIQTRDYASNLKGWIIDETGRAEFENVKIRGTLATTTFEKESVNAVGGQLFVANSTTITGSGVTALDTTMSVANASGFSSGEVLQIKKISDTGFTTEYVLVESASLDGDGSDPNSISGKIYVERGYTGGATPGNTFVGDTGSAAQAYEESQVIVSTGKIGTGYIRMNANPNDQSTPYIDIVERTGSGTYDVELKARLGDLSGLANSNYVFGRSNPGFGLATDNVYLQGGIIATFGEIGGFGISANTISSSNNNLILRDNGQITGSTVLLDGGTIGGFELSSTQINSTNDLLVLKSNGQITASAAMISGSGIQVYTPNFEISASGDVSANRIFLDDTARADSLTYTYAGLNATNYTSFYGTYSGSDGNVYTVLDLSGQDSKIDNTQPAVSFIRLGFAPAYPIGAIIHPFAYSETAGYNTSNTSTTIIVEVAAANIRFAADASVGSGTGKKIWDYTGTTLLYTDSKSTSTLFRSYIDENGGDVWYKNTYDNITVGPYTYSKAGVLPFGSQITLARGFFAWKLLGSTYYGDFFIGETLEVGSEINVGTNISIKNSQITSSAIYPTTSNTWDLGSTSKRWRTIYSINALNTSDKNEKKNISGSDLGLRFINSLNPVQYNWKWDDDGSPKHYGLIAQEVNDIVSNQNVAIVNYQSGSWSMAYTELISPMIKAIQELSDEVNQLKFELSQSRG
jgi:hypothetical protein